VVLEAAYSESRCVPQGSDLGLNLFILYVDVFARTLPVLGNQSLYADDLVLFPRFTKTVHTVQKALDHSKNSPWNGASQLILQNVNAASSTWTATKHRINLSQFD